MGWFNCLSLRFATLLVALLVTLAVAMHSHLTRVRTLDANTRMRSNSEFEDNNVGDPRVRISDIQASEGARSRVELINDLTTNFLEEAKALGEDLGEGGQFLEQLEQFRWFHCPAASIPHSTLYYTFYCTFAFTMIWGRSFMWNFITLLTFLTKYLILVCLGKIYVNLSGRLH